MSFAACKVLICLYFLHSKAKDWRVMAYLAILLATGSLIVTYFILPESPRFMEGQKNYDEANKSLKQMQKINRTNLNFQFDLS
jgi:hypothetical protein